MLMTASVTAAPIAASPHWNPLESAALPCTETGLAGANVVAFELLLAGGGLRSNRAEAIGAEIATMAAISATTAVVLLMSRDMSFLLDADGSEGAAFFMDHVAADPANGFRKVHPYLFGRWITAWRPYTRPSPASWGFYPLFFPAVFPHCVVRQA